MLAPVLRPLLLLELAHQVVLPARVVLEVLEVLEVPLALAATDLQLEEAEEVVVEALLATQQLQTAVPLPLQLFPRAPRLASRVPPRSSPAVLPTTPASVNLQLKLA